MRVAGLGRVNVGEKGMDQETIDHIALGFEEISRRLKALPRAVQELASREGRALAQAVAEHVLACYQSQDPNFLLEPARQGVVEAEEGAAREAFRGVTAEVGLASHGSHRRYRAVAAAAKTPHRLKSPPT